MNANANGPTNYLPARHPPVPGLPYHLDKERYEILPPAELPELDPQQAIGIDGACALLRGRGGKRPHPAVVRRWASKGWKATLRDDQGRVAEWRCRLPIARIGRDLVTMPAWVAWFERMRIRFSVPCPPKPAAGQDQ